MATVAVFGAGPAGVTAAWAAARAGHHVHLFERNDHVGGMAASPTIAGQRVDLGSHRLHPSIDPELLDALRSMLGNDLQTRERNGRIRLDGQFVGFPLRTTDLLRRLPPQFAASIARDVAGRSVRRLAGRRSNATAATFADEVSDRLGPTMLHRFYGPYARKLWGREADELDGELARRRVSASSPAAIVRRLVRARQPSGRSFLYPRQGFGQLSEALADAAVNAGATVHLATDVTSLEANDADGVRVNGGAGGELAVDADVVLSTLPAGVLARMLPVGEDVSSALATMEYRAMVLVYLVVNRPQYTAFDAHYLPDPGNPVARLSEPKNYRDGDDPDATTVLCAEVPCDAGDAIWELDDDALGAMVADALVRDGLPDPAPVACHSVRLPRVYPIYDVGFRRRIDPVLRALDATPRVMTLGRQGMFVPDNAHHTMAMGLTAASVITRDGAIDHAAWAAAQARFAAHIVED